MLDLVVLPVFNHLLDAAPWAREKLAPFAGRRARLVLGSWPLDFRIAPDGRFESLGTDAPAVEIVLPATALQRIPDGREALMRDASIRGGAEFAEALGFVLRHLDWDAEEDISRLIGDIAAHRLAKTARGFAAAQAEAMRRFVDNVDEYLRYERPTATRPAVPEPRRPV